MPSARTSVTLIGLSPVSSSGDSSGTSAVTLAPTYEASSANGSGSGTVLEDTGVVARGPLVVLRPRLLLLAPPKVLARPYGAMPASNFVLAICLPKISAPTSTGSVQISATKSSDPSSSSVGVRLRTRGSLPCWSTTSHRMNASSTVISALFLHRPLTVSPVCGWLILNLRFSVLPTAGGSTSSK